MNVYSELINKYEIMSDVFDFCVDVNVAKYNNLRKILEVGGGRAGWSLGINEFLGNPVDITMVENFEFLNYGSYGQAWPSSKSELLTEMNNKYKSHNICVLNIDANLIHNYINDNFDLIRIDCFEHEDELNQILKWSYSQLNDDGMLYIDDIKPTICINRLYSAISMVKEKMYKIDWIGDKSMILSKYKSSKDHFPLDLRNLIQNEIASIKFVIRDPVGVIGNNGSFDIKYWCTFN